MEESKFLVKSVLNDILRGFSFFVSDSKKLYIKHFSFLDTAEIDDDSYFYYKLAKESGLTPHEKAYSDALKQDTWSQEKQKTLDDEKLFYTNLLKTKQKFHASSEIEQIEEEISTSGVKIQGLEIERINAIGPTIETFVDNRVRELYVIRSLYKDSKLQKRLITNKEEKNIEKDYLDLLINFYNKEMNKFTRLNMKKAALNENYLSPFCLCDSDPYKFYGRPVVELTTFQMDLFIYAAKYKNIISDWKDIPPELLEDPEKLEETNDKRENIKKVIENNKGKGNLMIPGVSNEELKSFGFNKAGVDTNKLIETAKKHGGTLSLEDGMKAGVI